MAWLRTEQEAQAKVNELLTKNKGQYITQGVSFNKDSERQMELLKYVFMYSESFSGFMKVLIAAHENGQPPALVERSVENPLPAGNYEPVNDPPPPPAAASNIGNFL